MSTRPRLVIGVDGAAALRQLRRARRPDPVEVALVAEGAGADGIAAHLWQDRRAVQERDLRLLREVVRTELVVFLAPAEPEIEVALSVRPDRVVLVREREGEAEIEMGLDLGSSPRLEGQVRMLREAGIRVSALVEPELDAVKAAHRLDLDEVMLLCSRLAVARREERPRLVEAIAQAAKGARRLGRPVSTVGQLDLSAVEVLAGLEDVEEVVVDHAACAEAMTAGMAAVVGRFRARLVDGRGWSRRALRL